MNLSYQLIHSLFIHFLFKVLFEGKCVLEYKGHQAAIQYVDDIGGERIMSGDTGRHVHIWNANTGKLLETYEIPVEEDWGGNLIVYAGKNRVLIGEEMNVQLWDLKESRPICRLDGWIVGAVCMFANLKRVAATGGDTSRAAIYDLEDGALLIDLVGHTNLTQCVTVFDQDRLLATGSFDQTVRVWDAETGRCIHILEHDDVVLEVCVMADDTRLISLCCDNTLQVWDAQTGECLRVLVDGNECRKSCMFSSCYIVPFTDSNMVLSRGYDGLYRVWDVESGDCVRVAHKNLDDVCVLSDGRVATMTSNMVRILT